MSTTTRRADRLLRQPTRLSATYTRSALALLSALQRLARDECFALYLETLDDVVFETTGSALELLQLKHHCDRAANLTDASSDLWKSLRVWMDGRAHGTIPSDARLFLITTSDVGSGFSSQQADGSRTR
jgi:hypothetical protein